MTVTILWVAIAAGSILLLFFDPAKPGSFFPACPFRLITGLQCPGCGTLRGLHQLLHGHPLAAFELNPLLFIALPFLLFVLFSATRSAISGRPTQRFSLPVNFAWVFLAVVLFFWIFRNTSMYPFVS
jgi:hypothetical protein